MENSIRKRDRWIEDLFYINVRNAAKKEREDFIWEIKLISFIVTFATISRIYFT